MILCCTTENFKKFPQNSARVQAQAFKDRSIPLNQNYNNNYRLDENKEMTTDTKRKKQSACSFVHVCIQIVQNGSITSVHGICAMQFKFRYDTSCIISCDIPFFAILFTRFFLLYCLHQHEFSVPCVMCVCEYMLYYVRCMCAYLLLCQASKYQAILK